MRASMSNVAVSVGSTCSGIGTVLIIAERTSRGLVHPGKIEEMDRELTKVIKDFDRAVNVEALRLAKQTGKHSISSQSCDGSFSIVSCRARVFAWAV